MVHSFIHCTDLQPHWPLPMPCLTARFAAQPGFRGLSCPPPPSGQRYASPGYPRAYAPWRRLNHPRISAYAERYVEFHNRPEPDNGEHGPWPIGSITRRLAFPVCCGCTGCRSPSSPGSPWPLATANHASVWPAGPPVRWSPHATPHGQLQVAEIWYPHGGHEDRRAGNGQPAGQSSSGDAAALAVASCQRCQ